MKFITDYAAIVVVGAWNKSIFNHNWIKQFLLESEAKDLIVEIPLNIDGSERVSTDTIRIAVIDKRLLLNIKDTNDTVFSFVQDLVLRICDYLPHTPLEQFGFNYLFKVETGEIAEEYFIPIDKDKLEKIGVVFNDVGYKTSFKYKDKNINLSVTCKDSEATLDFNVNFVVKSPGELKEIIAKNDIVKVKNEIIELINSFCTIKTSE